MDTATALPCPLCLSKHSSPYHQDPARSYWQCQTCELVYVAPKYLLTPEQEKAQYDLHQNDPTDAGYRNFLARLATPLMARVPPPAQGLDFGSGPGPTLSVMLEEAGYNMSIYDPFYANNPDVLTRQYDLVTCTEVVEHLHTPDQVFKQLVALVKPRGWLGIMTKRVTSRDAFSRWHYKNDPTHVCFYSEATFHFLAKTYQLKPIFISNDVVLLEK